MTTICKASNGWAVSKWEECKCWESYPRTLKVKGKTFRLVQEKTAPSYEAAEKIEKTFYD